MVRFWFHFQAVSVGPSLGYVTGYVTGFASCSFVPVLLSFLYSFTNRLKPSGHYTYRTVVTIRTAQWSVYVPHSVHYTYRTVVTIRTARCNIQQFYVLPTQCIYVFCVDLRTNSDYFPIQH